MAEVFDITLKRTFVRSQTLDMPADGVVKLFRVPPGSAASDVYFLRLTLTDRHGRTLSHNFYWLPRQTSLIDWSFETQQKHPYYSDVLRWEDLSALQQLPAAQVQARARADRGTGHRTRMTVTLHNPSKALAFMVRLAAIDARDGHELLPVLWSDNYVALLPGEKRTMSAEFEAGNDAHDLALRVDGWNVPRAVLPVTIRVETTATRAIHR